MKTLLKPGLPLPSTEPRAGCQGAALFPGQLRDMTAGLWTREAKRSGRGSSGPCDAGRCRDLEETCSLSAEWHASICLPEESTRPAGGAASSPPSASAPWGRWPGLRPSLLTRTHTRRGPAPPTHRPGGAGRSSSLLWLPGCALGLSRDVLGTPAATQAFPPRSGAV